MARGNDLPQTKAQSFEQGPVWVSFLHRKKQVEDMLTVRLALDRGPVRGRHPFQQLRAHELEVGESAVVNESPGAVREGMGVLQSNPSDSGPPDMGQNGIGIGPACRTPEPLRLNRGLRLALDEKLPILVSCKSPAMKVTLAAEIFDALYDQRVLCVYERAFDLGELGSSKAVEAAHLLQLQA